MSIEAANRVQGVSAPGLVERAGVRQGRAGSLELSAEIVQECRQRGLDQVSKLHWTRKGAVAAVAETFGVKRSACRFIHRIDLHSYIEAVRDCGGYCIEIPSSKAIIGHEAAEVEPLPYWFISQCGLHLAASTASDPFELGLP